MDLLPDQRRVHAVRDLMDGDVALVKGLCPEKLRVDGDVIDVLQTVVLQGLHGDALANACLDVEFVAYLVVVLVGF